MRSMVMTNGKRMETTKMKLPTFHSKLTRRKLTLPHLPNGRASLWRVRQRQKPKVERPSAPHHPHPLRPSTISNPIAQVTILHSLILLEW